MLDMKRVLVMSLVTGALVFVGTHHAVAQEASQALAQLQLLQKNLKGSNAEANKAGNAVESKLSTLAKSVKTKTDKAVKQQRSQTTSDSGTVTVDGLTVSAPGSKAMTEQTVRRDAFNQVKERLFPLTTDQVVDLHKSYNEAEMANVTSPQSPPRPTATSQMVNLSPGATPPVIRLSQGFVSSVVFLDSSGAPWPIVAYDLGDPDSFNIQWDKAGNTLLIQAKKLYNYGNLAVRLEGLNTPVMLTLVPGQKAVDYRVDMRVQGYGPNAKDLPTGTGLPQAASNSLLKILEGEPPVNSARLLVKGGPAQAWALGDKMYVRTRLSVLSPGWIGMMTSGDGTHAYEMMKAPVLLVSWHGKVMQLKLEGL